MKVLILGASGIIGQHMRLCVPHGIEAVWHRKQADRMHIGCDLTHPNDLAGLLMDQKPEVVVNLAGESRPDVVEKNPEDFEYLNVEVPALLAGWCSDHGPETHYVHVSTQGVFGGDNAPYYPHSTCIPVNAYGRQKRKAEERVKQEHSWTIVRPTFVLGVRPMPLVGRENPVEQMLCGQSLQVNDRYFSPLFARDAASLIWEAVLKRPHHVVHLGNPIRTNRYQIARSLSCKIEGVSHDLFLGLAPRPMDTSYGAGSEYRSAFPTGLTQCLKDWEYGSTVQRSREIALFTGLTGADAFTRLNRGFSVNHTDVCADFKAAAPRSDEELLEWYRTTESYIWELSAFHADPGFNYAGMCRGIAERLQAVGAKTVLCLGDGIGDLTLDLVKAGLDATYHDLAGSRTAEFAKFRFWLHHPSEISTCETTNWEPDVIAERQYDAVISFDFLEHVTDVPRWTATIRKALVPGGWFFAQNAFGIGSGDTGSIPCHLSRNDRYEKDWTPLLGGLHFSQEGTSNWWKRAS